MFPTGENTYNSKRIRLNQNGLGEGQVRRFVQWHTLAGQRLQDRPVVQALVVGVGVDVAQHLAVDGGVPQPDDDLWLQVVLPLVVPVERVLEELWNAVVVRLRQEPLDRGALFGLQRKKMKIRFRIIVVGVQGYCVGDVRYDKLISITMT